MVQVRQERVGAVFVFVELAHSAKPRPARNSKVSEFRGCIRMDGVIWVLS